MAIIVYNNHGENRETFPNDESLRNLRKGLYAIHGQATAHESVIKHALLASSVVCTPTKDVTDYTYLASIMTGFTIFPADRNQGLAIFCKEVYELTKSYMSRILNSIPGGFEVKFIGMDPDSLQKWMFDIYNLSAYATDIPKMDSELKKLQHGRWIVKYSWRKPFSLKEDMIAADVVDHVAKILESFRFDGYDYSLDSKSAELNWEYLKDLVYKDLIRIQQHPCSKSSFLITVNKQNLSHCLPYFLSRLENMDDIFKACDYNLKQFESPFDLLAINTYNQDGYLGMWVSFKKEPVFDTNNNK